MIEVNYPPFLESRISLQPEANSKSLPELFKNEVVEGKVLKSISPGEALLLIKGRRVMARTHLPLSEGRVLSLIVEKIKPIPTFKLQGIKFKGPDALNISIILSALKENLWQSTFEAINRPGIQKEASLLFRKLMNDLSLELFSKAPQGLLKEVIDKSGLSWEAKLKSLLLSNERHGESPLNKLIEGDLKGLASRLLALEEGGGVLLKKFVSTMENIQLLNHLALEQDRKIFLPIPMQFPDGLFTLGQLLIHLPQEEKDESQKKKKDKDFFRVTFLLELSHLGPMRADLAIKGKDIEGTFLVTKEDVKLLIEKSIPVFIKSMREKGFSIRQIGCYLKDPEIVKESLLKEIIQEEGHSISLVA